MGSSGSEGGEGSGGGGGGGRGGGEGGGVLVRVAELSTIYFSLFRIYYNT